MWAPMVFVPGKEKRRALSSPSTDDAASDQNFGESGFEISGYSNGDEASVIANSDEEKLAISFRRSHYFLIHLG
jgi:hypothetical protein